MPFMGMATDQAPEAHRWKLEPSMQFHSPSLEQGPVCRPVEDPPLAGAGAGGEETPVPVGPAAAAVLPATCGTVELVCFGAVMVAEGLTGVKVWPAPGVTGMT